MGIDFQISLKAARVNARMTQKEVANNIGVDRQTIISWESGKSKIGVEDFFKLCDLYNVPERYISLPLNSTNSRKPSGQDAPGITDAV